MRIDILAHQGKHAIFWVYLFMTAAHLAVTAAPTESTRGSCLCCILHLVSKHSLHLEQGYIISRQTPLVLLTFIAFDGVHVNGRIKLAGGQRLGAVQGVAGTVGGRSNAAPIALALLLGLIVLALHLLLLGSLYIVDSHQQTVVHELQLGQELRIKGEVGHMTNRSQIKVAIYSTFCFGILQIESRHSFSVCKTYLHIFPELLQKHFLVLFIDVDLLPIIDEVIVLVGGQLLGLPVSNGG